MNAANACVMLHAANACVMLLDVRHAAFAAFTKM